MVFGIKWNRKNKKNKNSESSNKYSLFEKWKASHGSINTRREPDNDEMIRYTAIVKDLSLAKQGLGGSDAAKFMVSMSSGSEGIEHCVDNILRSPRYTMYDMESVVGDDLADCVWALEGLGYTVTFRDIWVDDGVYIERYVIRL
jgi:hypothetical protein